jgi:hypothetical protein
MEALAAPPIRLRKSSSVVTRSGARTWDIYGDTIVTSRGSVICETLVRYAPASIEAISITFSGPGGTFDTGVDLDQVDCETTAIAMYPTFSRDGRLAFLGSTRAIGIGGTYRLSKPMRIYLGPRANETVEPLGARELMSPSGFSWTPDGRGFIVSDRWGTFWIDGSTGRASQVLTFRLSDVSWSDDGTRLAAIRPTSPLG